MREASVKRIFVRIFGAWGSPARTATAAVSTKVRLGQFYTAPEVADLMINMATVPTDAGICEPSCGPGVFLERLALRGYGNLYGFDIDHENVSTAQARLAKVAAHPGAQVSITHRDYLRSDIDERYDLIIGNPPYVSAKNMDPDIREFLASDPFWATRTNGEWDLLYAFLIWSAHKLRPAGEMIFIVPTNWTTATYAATVRDELADMGAFELLLSFGEYRLFRDCAPNCIIFRYRRHPSAGRHLFVGEYDGSRAALGDVLAGAAATVTEASGAAAHHEKDEGPWRRFAMPPVRAGETWFFAGATERARVAEVEAACAGRTLGDVCDVAVGVVSGRDGAYLPDAATCRAIVTEAPELMASFVKAAGCARYGHAETTPMLFPYEVADEAELRRRSPTAATHLHEHRATLAERYMPASAPWFAWATVRNMPAFARHAGRGRVFVPAIDRAPAPRFAYTEHPTALAAGDTLMIAPKDTSELDPLFLLGWLNSTHVRAWYAAKGARTGGRWRYTRAYLAKIPALVPDCSRPDHARAHGAIVQLVRERLVAPAVAHQGLEERIERQLAVLMG